MHCICKVRSRLSLTTYCKSDILLTTECYGEGVGYACPYHRELLIEIAFFGSRNPFSLIPCRISTNLKSWMINHNVSECRVFSFFLGEKPNRWCYETVCLLSLADQPWNLRSQSSGSWSVNLKVPQCESKIVRLKIVHNFRLAIRSSVFLDNGDGIESWNHYHGGKSKGWRL